jgi:Ni,Fe-hydrogenase III small subunit/ferredoxin
MIKTLIHLLKSGTATQREMFPELPHYSRGLPMLTDKPCTDCSACVDACPTDAITISAAPDTGRVTLDLGRCIACGGCTDACPTGTIAVNRATRVATRTRDALILTNGPAAASPPTATPQPALSLFHHSLHIREVSTGDNATDMEVAASDNPIFDASRFGIHIVASPRFADALLVTGPVALAMQEPLRRCYDAMAEPRLVIAAGASAISGGLHADGYAQANGVDSILPVAAYIPGNPPHPWYILHGILLAMGHPALER